MFRRNKDPLTFYHREGRLSAGKIASVFSWTFTCLAAVLLGWFCVYTMGIRTSVIGSSMEPSLYNSQTVLINRVIYSLLQPSRGDVIVFRPNGNLNSHYYVKRVIGVPGDKIKITNGILYLNGEAQNELFTDKIADPGVASDTITIGDDEYFCMGDNCNNSEDSRSANLGNIRKEHIVGQAWLHMAGGSEGIGRVK